MPLDPNTDNPNTENPTETKPLDTEDWEIALEPYGPIPALRSCLDLT